MAKEIKVAVFVNKYYYQESSSRRTYGEILDNRYSILIDKSASITFSSPFSVNKEKLGQRRNSVAELSEDDRQTVHEEWQI